MKYYNLEQDYNKFSRAHLSYINQIFGDITVREIIQEIYKKRGKLIVEKSGKEFEFSYHHVYQNQDKNICSVEMGYQNMNIDINDNLCQSYSLMSYLEIPFDTTPSKYATIEQKRAKQQSMINMYRNLLENKDFVNIFSNDIVFEKNEKLWKDWTNKKTFYIIKKLKTSTRIIKNIKSVLDDWETYGWAYFVNDGLH